MSEVSALLWHDPEWQKQAYTWIRAQAEQNGIHLSGEIEQSHAYPWSTVMRVPSQAGTLFFKATASETVYESALTEALAGWFPELLPELIAVDTERGWMLMRDGGEPLRALIRPTQDIRPWEAAIRRYAELQIGLVAHTAEILSLGIPDRRLANIPGLFSQLLTDDAILMIDQEKGLTSQEWDQVRARTARVAQLCTELAAFGIPESLNHGDFHDGNVLVNDERLTFFDWGDASVTHPFVSLRTLFVSIEIALKLDDYAFTPEMAVLLDHYLEPWERFASKEKVQAAYRLSKPLAAIVSALSWYKTISPLRDSLRAQYAWILPELLREFLLHENSLSSGTNLF